MMIRALFALFLAFLSTVSTPGDAAAAGSPLPSCDNPVLCPCEDLMNTSGANLDDTGGCSPNPGGGNGGEGGGTCKSPILNAACRGFCRVPSSAELLGCKLDGLNGDDCPAIREYIQCIQYCDNRWC